MTEKDTKNTAIDNGITPDELPDELKTRRDKERDERAERVRAKFLATKERYPFLRPSRIAVIVAQTELPLGDGVKTSQGVINIIKKLGLWAGQRKYNRKSC